MPTSPLSDPTASLSKIPNQAIRHIPGERGWPVIGHFPEYIRNPSGFLRRMHGQYGPIFRGRALWYDTVFMLGEQANQLVMQDREQNFSSRMGWNFTLGELFPRGLMLRDFADHRMHRRVMQSAFRKQALEAYFGIMTGQIEQRVRVWAETREIKFYDAIKSLTLDLAASVFLGIGLGDQAREVNRSFTHLVAASITPVRRPIPGLPYRRGLEGRQYLRGFFKELLIERRQNPTSDLLGQLCLAEGESGERFDDEEIIDHMIFLMMAAHDTTTSALTSIVYSLGHHPEWQMHLREEAADVDEQVQFHQLNQLTLHEQVFKEALRLYAPVPQLPRRCIREFEFAGLLIPANTAIVLAPAFVHRMEQHWPDPDQFDPNRFSPDAPRHHPFAWVPFGGGAHMCIGLHFAGMQIKTLLLALLRHFEIELPDHYRMPHQEIPIPKPRDGLPIVLRPIKQT